MLNVELELKAEKENAEVRVTNVKDYQVHSSSMINSIWRVSHMRFVRAARKLKFLGLVKSGMQITKKII